MDETPLLPDETRPHAGGSYVRLPDGTLMAEADWHAQQAEQAHPTEASPTQAEVAPVDGDKPAPAARRRATEKEA